MTSDEKDAYRESLITVSALKRSMEHSLTSDPNAVWKHSSYRHYMWKYNDVVRYLRGLAAISAPIDLYNLDEVPHSGDTVMPVQKELFESVHANLSILEAWLSARVDLEAQESEDLRHFLEADLRKVIFEAPRHEREIQSGVEQLLIGRGLVKGVDYDREVGRMKVSIKEVVPDFILAKLSLALRLSWRRRRSRRKQSSTRSTQIFRPTVAPTAAYFSWSTT